LAERQLVGVAALLILAGERRRQKLLPAIKEPAHMLSREQPAELGQRGGIRAGAKPVIQRLERDPVMSGLLLGPLVAVQVNPRWERRVRDGLDERWTPIRVTDVEIEVVRVDRLTAVLEVRVAVRAAVTPPTPSARLLLTDPDHHDSVAAVALRRGEVLASDVLLDLALLELDLRDLMLGDERVDLRHVPATDLPEHRRRRDRVSAVQQKPDHLPLGHQPRDVRLQKQPIDRAHLKAHMIGE